MKLREVLTAISGFKYIVNEYDVPQTGSTTVKKIEIQCSNTNMRCLQFDLHHERLVGKKWHILTKEEFDHLATRNNKARATILRRGGVEISKKAQEAHMAANKLITTLHFTERLKERFNVDDVHGFTVDVFNDHFVVQGAEFYNTHRDLGPTDMYVCSIKHNAIFAIKFDKGHYFLITAYPAKTTKWFTNWFNDHLDKVQDLPTIGQFFKY